MFHPWPGVALNNRYVYWLLKSKEMYFHIEHKVQGKSGSGLSYWFNSSIKDKHLSIILLYCYVLVTFVFSQMPPVVTRDYNSARHHIQT